MAYFAPAAPARFEQEIQRSRFIGIANEAHSEAGVARRLEAVAAEFPTATHHCWAYILGDPQNSTKLKSEDDGEPSGTAGRPILSVLQRKAVGDVVLVVVRYFGGIKLGAGGLVRAYSGTANKTIDALPLEEKGARLDARLTLEYPDEPRVKAMLAALDVAIESTEFTDVVTLRLRIPSERLPELRSEIEERTRGRGRLELTS